MCYSSVLYNPDCRFVYVSIPVSAGVVLGGSVRDYKQFFADQNKAQTEKLSINEHKGGLDIPLNECIDMLKEEYEETVEAFREAYSKKEPTLDDIKALRHEFADGANINGFGIRACDKIIRNMKGEPQRSRNGYLKSEDTKKGKPVKVYFGNNTETVRRYAAASYLPESRFISQCVLRHISKNEKSDAQGVIRIKKVN